MFEVVERLVVDTPGAVQADQLGAAGGDRGDDDVEMAGDRRVALAPPCLRTHPLPSRGCGSGAAIGGG